MKKLQMLVIPLLFFALLGNVQAQSKLFYQVALNFPAFGMPGYRLGENFRNLGLSVGVTYPLNQAETTGLRFDLGHYRTRSQGSSFYLQSQFSVHPRIGKLEVGFDVGLGYQLNQGAGKGWDRDEQGQWQSQTNRTALFFVPAGLHLGYRASERWRPFVQYQAQALLGYNEAFPVFPLHLISIGQTFKF